VRMQGPDRPYWAISNVTIPLGAFLTFFKVTIPEPGEYTVVLTLQSPDLYDKEDHRYEDTFVARARRSWSDLRRLFHDSAVNVLDHDFAGSGVCCTRQWKLTPAVVIMAGSPSPTGVSAISTR
jgi:hypothetical protein